MSLPLSGIRAGGRPAPFAGGLVARDGVPRPFQWAAADSGPASGTDDTPAVPPGQRELGEASLVGTVLEGAYRITRLIAMGGMSTVYEATQLRLNQRVAVKVMARELAANEEALARFRREAEVTSRLRHPHLVGVSDFGTAPGGQPFLVMEYLEGIDLEERIRQRGPLPLSTVVSIAQQAAAALAAAHDQGIVHRDLKPANVFLVDLPGEPEFVKILDFGISKVRAATSQLTKASFIIGTPYYMSPEQATGMIDDIDHRTDQWALACIAWEMLSGRVPFAGDDMSAVFYQIIHLDPSPLGARVPDLSAAVEAVLTRALSKRMADRFPSVRAFATALESAAGGLAEPPEPRASSSMETWTSAPQPRHRARDAWRAIRREPIFTIAALCAAVLLAVLVGSAGPGKRVDTLAPGPAPAATMSEPSREPTMTMSAAPGPSAERGSFPAAGSPDAVATTKAAVVAAKPKAAPPRAPAAERAEAAEPADPFQPPAAVDDPADPFAPPAPAGAPQAEAAPTKASDPADPFAP